MSTVGLSLIAVCTAAVVGLFLYAFVSDASARGRISSMSVYMAQSDVASVASTMNANDSKIRALQQYGALASENVRAFGNLTTIDSALLKRISAALPSGTQIVDLDYSAPVFKISCSATGANAAAAYTGALQKTGDFAYATYGSIQQSGGSYLFTIQCALKGGSSR